MTGVGLVLVWLPVFGPLIAGFAGGRIIGRPGWAVVVALMPAIMLGALTVAGGALVDRLVLGALAGTGLFVLIAVQDMLLVFGAYLGGVLAE